MPNYNPLISVRVSQDQEFGTDILSRTEKPADVSQVAKRDLRRYYEGLRRALPTFSEVEATLIVNALNGKRHADPESMSLLWAEVHEDDPILAERMRSLSYIECTAIIDAVERFWLGPYHQEGPIGARLREVGLVKDGH